MIRRIFVVLVLCISFIDENKGGPIRVLDYSESQNWPLESFGFPFFVSQLADDILYLSPLHD